MTAEATPADVKGDFSGATLQQGSVTARMARDGRGGYQMTFTSPGAPPRTVEVVRTVGSRRYQQYLARDGDTYWRLPVAWHVEEQRWFPMTGAFLFSSEPWRVPHRPASSGGQSPPALAVGSDRRPVFGGGDFNRHVTRWNDNCVFCHNVAPNPARDPGSGRFATTVAELGVACEACHGPGAEHAARNANPLRRWTLRSSGAADPTIVNPSRLTPARAADLCGRCHGQRIADQIAPLLEHGDPFVPGDDLAVESSPLWRDTPLGAEREAFAERFWDDGTPRLTAYEYQGLLQSPCTMRGPMTCTSCHGMHEGDPRGQIRARFGGRASNTICTGCHTALAAPEASRSHAHHDPAGEGGQGGGTRCVSCHMPRIVYGVLECTAATGSRFPIPPGTPPPAAPTPAPAATSNGRPPGPRLRRASSGGRRAFGRRRRFRRGRRRSRRCSAVPRWPVRRPPTRSAGPPRPAQRPGRVASGRCSTSWRGTTTRRCGTSPGAACAACSPPMPPRAPDSRPTMILRACPPRERRRWPGCAPRWAKQPWRPHRRWPRCGPARAIATSPSANEPAKRGQMTASSSGPERNGGVPDRGPLIDGLIPGLIPGRSRPGGECPTIASLKRTMAETYPLKFGKYVLLKPMARGGMGAIFLAAAGELGFQKFCVVKKVIAEKSDRAKANRFLDEAKVVLRLSHANLVPTFDAGEVDGEFYIAMELVEGKDLREIWNRCVRTRTRIPLDVALHVAREIARALAYVHSHADLRLVHRDVAPPNILISYFGEVKLTDFGLARSVLKQENTAPGVVFGRASYLSPEQARGEIADARTDIYSLGIVLWELVTGNQYLQLANLDPATAMSLVRHPRAQPPSSKAPWITPNLDALLMRSLAPDREHRFQSAEEMRKALSEIIAQISPRADAERTADFLRALYDQVAKEERAERDKLLADSAALFAPPHAPARRRACRCRCRCSNRAAPSWQFPKEDESMGVDFTGRVIDSRYRVIRKIGEGGMGTVYAGEHVEIGKDVAMKILHPAYSTQQDLVERFRREARAASRIGHPHIIDVTDFGETEDGCAYFVMEHLDGIDLADVLSHERRLAPERACKIATQICRALAAAHAAGVIHRDLKPENIFLVARDGQADFVKVLDFGIARSMGRARRLTNPGVAMGTPEYMAPEQAEGGAVDQRSDIYSVGALIYEMVSGSPPQMSRDKELIPPRGIKADVPEELDRIVVRALEADPARRYQSMAQFEYDLVKSLFGRSRAVSEMLGLHDQERGVVPEISYSDEAPGGTHPRADSPPAAPRRAASPVPPPSRQREEERGADAGVSGAAVAGARDSGGGWRYAGTFAALALVGVGGGDDLPAAPLERARADGRRTGATVAARGAGAAERRRSPGAARCAAAWPTWSACWGAERVRVRAAPRPARAARAAARRRRHGHRRHPGDPGQGAPGEGGRGGARPRRDRGRRRALPDRAGARRPRRRRGRAGGGPADARAVGAVGQQGHRGGALGARGGGVFGRRRRRARAPGRLPARPARGRRGGHRVRKGAGHAPGRSDLHPQPQRRAARAGHRRQAGAHRARASRDDRPPRRRPSRPCRRRRPKRRPAVGAAGGGSAGESARRQARMTSAAKPRRRQGRRQRRAGKGGALSAG